VSEGRRSPWGLARAAHVILAATLLLTGCAGSRKLDKPVPLQDTGAIVAAADGRIAATIDSVIVRDGPGSWASNANWDEYLLRVRTTSGDAVQITGVAIVDSLGMGVAQRNSRPELLAASEEHVRRYKDAGINVQAGVGAATLFGSGAAVLGASAVGGLAAISAGGVAATTAGATAAAAGAVIVAPALILAGTVVAVQDHEVDQVIKSRNTPLPLSLAADQQEQRLDVFFPLAPSPGRMLVNYRDGGGQHTLVIDTKAALAGLHLPGPAP
jgi:hypothetical protein